VAESATTAPVAESATTSISRFRTAQHTRPQPAVRFTHLLVGVGGRI
jgi:hypothetical protein